MIILNGGNMALAIHYDHDEKIQNTCQIFEHVFTVIFTVELMLRGYFEKPRNIVFDLWNLFDLVLLIVAYSEMIISLFGADGYMSWFRIFRIIRLFRIVRPEAALRESHKNNLPPGHLWRQRFACSSASDHRASACLSFSGAFSATFKCQFFFWCDEL